MGKMPGLAMRLASLLSVGSRAESDAEYRRRQVLQFCGLLGIFSMVLYAGLFALAGWRELAWPILVSLACVPCYALVMAANRRGHSLAAKLLLCLLLAGSMFVSTWFFLGKAPGMHYFFLLAAMVTVLIFTIKELPFIVGFMLLDLAGFILVNSRQDESAILVKDFPQAWLGFYQAMAIIAVYLTTVFILVYFQRRADGDARAIDTKARQMEELMRKYEELAKHDSLTGLFNRRAMVLCLQEEIVRMTRNHSVFSLIMFDIDRFKEFNDQHGHEAGDLILQEVARVCAENLREVDHVARWGGEEFLVLLPDTGQEGAATVAEKLRSRMEARAIRYQGKELRCTVTLGIAQHELAAQTIEDTIRQADQALYQGKSGGRNRVVSTP